MPSCYPCPTPGIYINQQGSGGSNASQYRAHCSHSPLHNLSQWSCNVRSVEPLKRQTSLSTKNYRPVLKGSNSGLRWFQQYERRNIIHWVLAFYWFSNFFFKSSYWFRSHVGIWGKCCFFISPEYKGMVFLNCFLNLWFHTEICEESCTI